MEKNGHESIPNVQLSNAFRRPNIVWQDLSSGVSKNANVVDSTNTFGGREKIHFFHFLPPFDQICKVDERDIHLRGREKYFRSTLTFCYSSLSRLVLWRLSILSIREISIDPLLWGTTHWPINAKLLYQISDDNKDIIVHQIKIWKSMHYEKLFYRAIHKCFDSLYFSRKNIHLKVKDLCWL